MSRLDLKKEHRDAYQARRDQIAIVEIPALNYLAVSYCNISLSSTVVEKAWESIYPVAYKLLYASKANDIDFVLMPLEAYWRPSTSTDGSQWDATLLIAQPDHITGEMVDRAKGVVHKGRPDLDLQGVRLDPSEPGKYAQLLHIGSHSDRGRSISRLSEQVDAIEHSTSRSFHEVYLNGSRGTKPVNCRTIIRKRIRVGASVEAVE